MLNSTQPMAGRNRPRMMKRRLSEAAISPRLVGGVGGVGAARSAAAARPRPAPATERLLPPLPGGGAGVLLGHGVDLVEDGALFFLVVKEKEKGFGIEERLKVSFSSSSSF